MSFSLSVCLSTYLFDLLFTGQPVCLLAAGAWRYVYLSVSPVYWSIYMSVCLTTCLMVSFISVRLTRLSLCLQPVFSGSNGSSLPAVAHRDQQRETKSDLHTVSVVSGDILAALETIRESD